MSSLPLVAYDPVSAVFGQGSTIARLNKSMVDPGGLLFKSEHILGKEFESKVDFMGWGGRPRYEAQAQQEEAERAAEESKAGMLSKAKSEGVAEAERKIRRKTHFVDPLDDASVGYGAPDTFKV